MASVTPSNPTTAPAPHPNHSNNVGVSVSPTSKPSTKKTTRAGAPNYSMDDITALLDFVENEEPLGSNHWAVVANKFSSWAPGNGRPERDQDSLKNKFDKLANTKKKTGDPHCPVPVRRAKLIARAIHNKCVAMTLGDSSGGDDHDHDHEDNVTGGSSDAYSDGNSVVGQLKKKRKTAATGLSTKNKVEQAMLIHIGQMSEHVGSISDTIKERSSAALSKSDVINIVKEELSESMKPTNDLLLKMNKKLEVFAGKNNS